MIDSLSRRWNVTVYSYSDTDELVSQLQQFVLNVVRREKTGEPADPSKDDSASDDPSP